MRFGLRAEITGVERGDGDDRSNGTKINGWELVIMSNVGGTRLPKTRKFIPTTGHK